MLKWIGIVLAALIVLAVAAYVALNEPRPVGAPGPEAEALADKLLRAVNKAAWDTTATVAWDFDTRQQHRWRRDVDSVEVQWDNIRVDLHTETVTGTAYENGEVLSGYEASEAVQQAFAHFINDAFWLAAPFKVRDPGTSRSIVKLEDGRDALLVEYASGGVTPGDAYLWTLDDNGLPESYKMWVSIIPIGGVEATWEDWRVLPSGAKVATTHAIGPMQLVVDVH